MRFRYRFLEAQIASMLLVNASIGGGIAPIGRAAYAAAKFGVEGFAESLYKELRPLGVKVTIVEPGGFSSTSLCEGRPEYAATVGATVRFQRDYDGKQPGDPAKAAAVLLHIASLSDPPLRLLLGTDSYNAAERLPFRNSSWTENGKISASQVITRPTTFLARDQMERTLLANRPNASRKFADVEQFV